MGRNFNRDKRQREERERLKYAEKLKKKEERAAREASELLSPGPEASPAAGADQAPS